MGWFENVIEELLSRHYKKDNNCQDILHALTKPLEKLGVTNKNFLTLEFKLTLLLQLSLYLENINLLARYKGGHITRSLLAGAISYGLETEFPNWKINMAVPWQNTSTKNWCCEEEKDNELITEAYKALHEIKKQLRLGTCRQSYYINENRILAKKLKANDKTFYKSFSNSRRHYKELIQILPHTKKPISEILESNSLVLDLEPLFQLFKNISFKSLAKLYKTLKYHKGPLKKSLAILTSHIEKNYFSKYQSFFYMTHLLNQKNKSNNDSNLLWFYNMLTFLIQKKSSLTRPEIHRLLEKIFKPIQDLDFSNKLHIIHHVHLHLKTVQGSNLAHIENHLDILLGSCIIAIKANEDFAAFTSYFLACWRESLKDFSITLPRLLFLELVHLIDIKFKSNLNFQRDLAPLFKKYLPELFKNLDNKEDRETRAFFIKEITVLNACFEIIDNHDSALTDKNVANLADNNQINPYKELIKLAKGRELTYYSPHFNLWVQNKEQTLSREKWNNYMIASKICDFELKEDVSTLESIKEEVMLLP